MDTLFNGKISLKLCTESLAHKSDFLAEAVKKSNSKKIEFSSTSHLNPVDFFIFLFSSSCLSVTIILSDNTVRNIKVTPKAVEVKIYQKLSVQRNYPFNEIYSTCGLLGPHEVLSYFLDKFWERFSNGTVTGSVLFKDCGPPITNIVA